MKPKFSKLSLVLFSVGIFFFLIVLLLFLKNRSVTNQPTASQNQTPPTTTITPLPVNGPRTPKSQKQYTLNKQQEPAYNFLQNNPPLVDETKKLIPDFSPADMSVSTPIANVKLSNGHNILLLWGCTPHFCGSTEIIIAQDQTDNKTYTLTQKNTAGKEYVILGDPSPEIQDLLLFYYTNQ